MAKANRWEDLALTIDDKEQEIKILREEWKDIQNKCNHPNLPKHVSYCYSVGEI